VRDTDVFGVLLGLNEHWKVSSVALDEDRSEVHLLVEHLGVTVCPECGKSCPVHDHSAERRWRHLDTMQYVTWVVCRSPRVNCRDERNNLAAIRCGIPAIGWKLVNKYGLEWVVDGHVYVPRPETLQAWREGTRDVTANLLCFYYTHLDQFGFGKPIDKLPRFPWYQDKDNGCLGNCISDRKLGPYPG
jgi:hypothetical protein